MGMYLKSRLITFLVITTLISGCGSGGGGEETTETPPTPASRNDTLAPVITVTGDGSITVTRGNSYSDLGATAVDNVDGTVTVNTANPVDTSVAATYTITYTAVDVAGNSATATRTVNVVLPPGVNVSSVRGNTAAYNAIAEFDVSLKSPPSDNVVIPVSSSDENEGVVMAASLTFTADNWNLPQTVITKGRNRSVENGIQDYKVVLAAAQSNDPLYNGFDSNDVDMKGTRLTLAEPTGLLSLVSGLETNLTTNVVYTGNERLSYALEEKPDGMTIEINSGLISWTPAQANEGNDYSVRVKVTDGILFAETSFNVAVIGSTPLQTQVSGNIVSVADGNSNLNGLSVQLVGANLDPSEIALSTLPESALPAIPSHIQRTTDFFLSKPVSGELKIKLPLSQIPAGTNLEQISLYNLAEADGIDGKFWSPVGIGIDISETQGVGVVEIVLSGLQGAFFVGVDSTPSTENRGIQQDVMFSRAQVSDVDCDPSARSDGSLNYNEQTCTIASNSSVEVTVLGFGSTATATRWNGTSIEELLTWLIDAQEGFDNLDMGYDDEFTVRVHTMPRPSYLGYVTTGNNEDRKTLHLTSANKSKVIMRGTSVHEYFHHAQGRSAVSGRDLLINGGSDKKWLIEGTARWFEDYLFDDLNTYTLKERYGSQILQAGLNSTGSGGVYRPYQRFSFFKLLKEKCSGFEGIFKELLNVDRSQDSSGILNLSNEMGNAGCSFGSHLGSEKVSSLEAALVYYQYATLHENKMSLLDANENDDDFNFLSTVYSYEKSDWFDVGEVKSANVSQITNIPAYGAYSIKIKGDMWDDIEEGKEAVLRVKVNAGSSPLTVSLLSEDASFTGNSLIDGIQHRYYRTNEISEYIFSQDELVPLFITLVNPNGSNVAISEIIFEIRDKLSPALEVTSPANNSDVNNRVISVTGNVPETAVDVDRVVITNGDIKTVTTVASNRSFTADVVVAMGLNTLVAQGYNSGDLTKPLTKESIINVNGVENTSGGRNALVASRIALVLRWKTNGTDVDIYSTDMNDNTIWYSNLSAAPGFLDYDNTSGYGPEVVSYQKTDDAIYVNGTFDVDMHYYRGSEATSYSLDVILNETDLSNVKVRHYESIQALPAGNSSEDEPTGSGDSRFNDILSITCNSQRICSIGAVDTSKLSSTVTVTQASVAARAAVSTGADASPYEKCMAEYNLNIDKAGYVGWECHVDTGAKLWR